MAGIRIGGMASGLPPNIVEQIIEAERIPLRNIEFQKSKEDEKLKLVNELETKVSEINKNLGELVGTRGFLNKKMVSGDPSIIDGTVDPEKSVNGQWHVEVMQLAQKPGAMTNGFPDRDKTELGTGYLKFKTPEGIKEVYISGNTTLDAVASRINNSGTGLRATVINDRSDEDNPFRLLITGLSTGKDNKVEFPQVYLLDGDEDMYFEKSKEAQNAKIKLDGFEIEVPDNVVTDLIPGVTLDLKQAAPGREIRINLKDDLEVISGKIQTFVDAYNGALGFIQNQSKLQKGPDGRERLGPLGGDSMTRTIESMLRRVIINPIYGVDSPIQRINELGIEFNRNGTLNFNKDKFNAALEKNPAAVAGFLRGDGFKTGFVPTVRREIGNVTNSFSGPLGNRKRSIEQKIKSMDGRIENMERQLQKKEESLRRKFSDLESKMAQLNQQSAAMAGQARG